MIRLTRPSLVDRQRFITYYDLFDYLNQCVYITIKTTEEDRIVLPNVYVCILEIMIIVIICNVTTSCSMYIGTEK